MGAEKVEKLKAIRIEGLPRFRAAAATSAPSEATKYVYLIRHGQAVHNVQPKPWGEDLIDARLTEEGRQQVSQRLHTAAAELPVELIVVSPLCRAIDTAVLGLAPHISCGVPVISCEDCREQLGQNLPDKRRAVAVLRAEYPAIDFNGLSSDDDALFTPVREPLEALGTRADRFLEFVIGRPEQHIAVATHSSFLAALCNVALDTSAAPEMDAWFENAEIRLLRLERRS